MYNVAIDEIEPGRIYIVVGAQDVTYNSVTYHTGDLFKGVAGFYTFVYSGSGTQIVTECFIALGGSIEFQASSVDDPVFVTATDLKGFAMEFSQRAEDIVVNDITALKGFAMELIDYPFYAFQITKTIRKR